MRAALPKLRARLLHQIFQEFDFFHAFKALGLTHSWSSPPTPQPTSHFLQPPSSSNFPPIFQHQPLRPPKLCSLNHHLAGLCHRRSRTPKPPRLVCILCALFSQVAQLRIVAPRESVPRPTRDRQMGVLCRYRSKTNPPCRQPSPSVYLGLPPNF